MPVITLIAVFIFAPLSHQREDDECGLDFTTVLVAKARGRIGNHVWLIMSMINYELKYGVKAYITEESRWILNEYFKGMYIQIVTNQPANEFSSIASDRNW